MKRIKQEFVIMKYEKQKIYNKKRNNKDRIKRNKPWFTNDIRLMKKNLKTASKAFSQNERDDSKRQYFFKLKKNYKAMVSSAKNKFKQSLYHKLEDLNEKNPKEYWELFNTRTHPPTKTYQNS